MRLTVKTKNVTPADVTEALSRYILHEHLRDDMVAILQKADDHHEGNEPIPERYMKTIVKRLNKFFLKLRVTLDDNVRKWFEAHAKPKRWWQQKGVRVPGDLTDDEVDELRRLIESHFKMAIGIDVRLPTATQKKWQVMQIALPEQDSLKSGVIQAYVAGRLQTILDNNDTYEKMLQEAKRFQPTRQDQLMMDAVTKNAAKYIVGYGRKLADLTEDMLLQRHKGNVHDVVQRYFSGELTQTTYNEEGFTPEEAEKWLSTNKSVQGWRELATELKNRFKQEDIGRDWDRIARSETRFASNLGALITMQEEGGGDPETIYLYYNVHPTACRYCKQLYLHTDGTPKLFKLATILANIEATGGMNVGKKASLIGEEGGWLPNALVHPNDQCVPYRYIERYTPFQAKEGDLR